MSDLMADERATANAEPDGDPQEPPSPNWIVAYAMGLVASGLDVGGVDELARHAGNDVSSLMAARRHLHDGMVVGDERLREGAAQLLEAALDRTRSMTSGEPDRVVVLDP